MCLLSLNLHSPHILTPWKTSSLTEIGNERPGEEKAAMRKDFQMHFLQLTTDDGT